MVLSNSEMSKTSASTLPYVQRVLTAGRKWVTAGGRNELLSWWVEGENPFTPLCINKDLGAAAPLFSLPKEGRDSSEVGWGGVDS